jgi:hypothetical protein
MKKERTIKEELEDLIAEARHFRELDALQNERTWIIENVWPKTNH